MASAAAISAATAAATVPFPRPATWLPIHHICGKIITPKGFFFPENTRWQSKQIESECVNAIEIAGGIILPRRALHARSYMGKSPGVNARLGLEGGGAGADCHAGNSRPSCAIRINWGLGLNMNGLIDLLFHPRCICLLPVWRWWTLEFATE